MKRTIAKVMMTKKKTNNRPKLTFPAKRLAAALLGGAMLVPAAALWQGATLFAQRATVVRVAEGTVENKAGTLVKGAVVYLKDTRSLAVKSYVTNDQGYFHFTQLSPDTDYEIWAELNGNRTKSKSISNFDTKKDFVFHFKLDE